jgi:hypothetical protein
MEMTSAPLFVTMALFFVTCAPLFVTMAPLFVTVAPLFVTVAPLFVTVALLFATCAPLFETCAPLFVTMAPLFVACAPLFVACAPLFVACALRLHVAAAPCAASAPPSQGWRRWIRFGYAGRLHSAATATCRQLCRGRPSMPTSKRVPPAKLLVLHDALRRLADLPDYAPMNQECAVDALRAAEATMLNDMHEEDRWELGLNTRRANTTASQQRFLRLMQMACQQVIAQYGSDSHVVEIFGRKRTSERKKPRRSSSAGKGPRPPSE